MADTSTPLTPRQIADAYLDALAAHNPVVAAGLGINLDDDRQPDLSPAGFEAEAELARRALADLAAATGGAEPADPAEAACARLLHERLTAELACHDAGDHLRSLNNISSPLHSVRSVFTIMATATDNDWSVIAGRLRNVPGAVEGYRQTLAEGVRRGLLSGPRQVETVIGQLGSWISEDGRTGWFAEFAADGPEALRAELDAAADQAGAAAARFRDWLRDEYATAAADASDVAGRELYLRSARRLTGADLDLDEAYGWAWGEFARLEAEMRAEAQRVLPGADPMQAVEHLEQHGHRVGGAEGIRAWLQGIMDEAIAALDGVHFDLDGPLREVESMIAPEGSAAAPYYTEPSLDFSRTGRTWLPTLGREEFPTWQLVSTWYHEGVPGHHLHLTQRMRCADRLSRYQTTIGGVSAEIEGWALYSERFMDELGFFSDPGRRLGFLDEQMLRTIRVIIDIGMHLELEIPADAPFHPGERWTPALATEFFATYNGCPAEMRESEITRYLGWPGQAIGYKLGERAWLRGREQARAAHGADFDLKAWHMKALSQGATGLGDLTARLAAL
ncbi:DUF885 domain-containing protein [Streptacidiphilus sp. PB12-B1b]|uniref:DUF885 domain-containing protein n=1 Tax=Streptacidiphilus sp. PB12-B1b TaxID=2705012 RepID=UPI0015FBDA6A|nr:DUF885 domain-containing protein [Streptacidiphilus sp. PB12-B1b]QMU79172.1 DUF885 domain-containing protein [Streptacidiphilus sp. PB12-B1b]